MLYKKRLLEQKLKRLSEHYPVVVLTGARQVGKTTMLEHIAPNASHITFDPIVDVGNARQDPELFLNNLKTPALLDEIQYAPELLPTIKRLVDRHKKPGQYYLTGSQNLSVIKNISESLAGRAAVLSLSPMTVGEMYRAPSTWIVDFLQDPLTFVSNSNKKRINLKQEQTLFNILWRGFYPGLASIDADLLQDGLESYLRTYIERDLRLLSDVSDLHEFTRFTRLCASLSATEINHSQIGREIGVTPQTAQRWLNILINTYQWTSIPPYFGNTIKRISQKRKGYFIDTGLLCYLMQISSPMSLASHPHLGFIFETFVVQDLIRQLASSSYKPAMYHWRSQGGAEVDFILELDNCFYPIEIKCKSRPSKGDIRGIKAFRDSYPKLNIGPGLVIAPTEQIFALGDACFAIPFDLL